MSNIDQNPFLTKEGDALVITQEGHKFLKEIVTDTQGPVYVFKDTAPGVFVAASMARLSRRGSDLREIYLDEFALAGPEKAEGLLRRVITDYGDDSVQQLLVLSFVVENASNILTKMLEWGRLAAYLEQSTRYIYYDQPNPQGKFRYFTPWNFSKGLTVGYENAMNQIFFLYSETVHGITKYLEHKVPKPEGKQERIAWKNSIRAQACDAARPMLPAATTSTVGIVMSAQSVESLILHLQAHPLEECRRSGLDILREVRKVAPVFFERSDMPSRGGSWVVHKMDTQLAVREMAKRYLPVGQGLVSRESVELLNYWPRNEMELVSDLFFAEADEIPAHILIKEIERWPDERKRYAIAKYVGERLNRRHKPGRAFEEPHYKWQITGDYGTFRDLQRHRMADMFEWQRLTTAYGYDIPEQVKEAGFEKPFHDAFAISERLYHLLSRSGYEEESQYATLMGHKMRYRFMLNLRASFHFHELRTTPHGHPGYRKIVKSMHDKVAEVHPLLASHIIFVNKDEDPELTRYAAELASQRKLAILESHEK